MGEGSGSNGLWSGMDTVRKEWWSFSSGNGGEKREAFTVTGKEAKSCLY